VTSREAFFWGECVLVLHHILVMGLLPQGPSLPKVKSLLGWSLQQSTGPNGGPTTQQSTELTDGDGQG
jgi:hypothetical protein